MSMQHSVNIVIPTYNRESIIADAIEAALNQTYSQRVVTVIDDGSEDNTRLAVAPYLSNPQVRYVALANNGGTAQAKNVAIALNDCTYISFHDSDDLPHPEKIARQVDTAAAGPVETHPVLNWSLVGTESCKSIDIDLVVHEHTLVCADGTRHHIRRALSLVDDVFPNLQMAAGVPGDWILINCGLFRASVFSELGGFKNCIEEDRELRNRLLFDGRAVWLIPEVLLTKYECEDSLTVQHATNYDSELRTRDRADIWRNAEDFRKGVQVQPEVMDLSSVQWRYISPGLTPSDALMTASTRSHLTRAVLANKGTMEHKLCIA